MSAQLHAAARATQLEGGQERKGILWVRLGVAIGEDGKTVNLLIVLMRTFPLTHRLGCETEWPSLHVSYYQIAHHSALYRCTAYLCLERQWQTIQGSCREHIRAAG